MQPGPLGEYSNQGLFEEREARNEEECAQAVEIVAPCVLEGPAEPMAFLVPERLLNLHPTPVEPGDCARMR